MCVRHRGIFYFGLCNAEQKKGDDQMEELLKDKICVVTGGSRGIGRAIAEAFAKQKAIVIITYRSNEKSAQETITKLREMGAKAMAIKADAGNENDVIAMKNYVQKEFGVIDVLVNNAGTIGSECGITKVETKEWDRVINTDLKGVFLNIKYFVPLFRKNSIGKILNISSELSVKGRADYVPYAAAKGAVNAITRSLALELAPQILVNTLAPGPIETDMVMKEMSPEWIEREKDIPLKRLGNTIEIAATAVLLASDYGNFYCGQFISPNGGAVFV